MNRFVLSQKKVRVLAVLLLFLLFSLLLFHLLYQGQTAVLAGRPQSGPTLAPFWNIVPLADGTEMLLQAENIQQQAGTVYFNIDGDEQIPNVGPSNYKHSYAMVLSGTNAYVGTAMNMTPGASFAGQLNISTTTNVASQNIDLARFYVESPIVPPFDMLSEDALFQASFVSTDTIDITDSYIALASNEVPPDPITRDHTLISQSYLLRSSAGALANRPFSVRLYYNSAMISGVDPFHLGIFKWSGSSWVELDARLFPEMANQFLTTATDQFTTYVLLIAPRWYDDFDDIEGLDASQLNNVTLGLIDGQIDALVLSSGQTEGTAVSRIISPSIAVASWGTLSYDVQYDSAAASLTVDVLAADGTLLLANVSSGSSLESIDPALYPALRLRANLATTVSGETPRLDSWRLTWVGSGGDIYLPLILKQN